MTPLTDDVCRTSITEAPLTGKPKRSLADVLADPRVRLAAGSAALLATAMAVRRDHVGPGEAAAFRAINGLPGWLYPPAWLVMQLGTLGAAPAAAGAAWLARDRDWLGTVMLRDAAKASAASSAAKKPSARS